jgi:hypothetical protein
MNPGGRAQTSLQQEWILVVSSASSNVIGGKTEGKRFANIVFPDPGGPIQYDVVSLQQLRFPYNA